MNHAIGLDIGGANLKAAHSDGRCRSVAFPVWREPQNLPAALEQLIRDWLPCRTLAVTMTAELADCFETKAAGVIQILQAVNSVAAGRVAEPVQVWQTSGEFVPTDVACEFPMLTAAANWHGLATFVGRMVPDQTAILLDIGSTTTDIIPVVNGLPEPRGKTDAGRLISGELVYTGVRRTPLCALAQSVPIASERCPLGAELFATTLDVYLLLNDIPEDPADCDTANGRPATINAAHDRLARQFCRDRTELAFDLACDAARELADCQNRLIHQALERVVQSLPSPCSSVIISGSGSFLARRLVQSHPLLRELPGHSLADMFSAETATSACAFALARLAVERT